MSQKKARCPLCDSTKLEIVSSDPRVIEGDDCLNYRLRCGKCKAISPTQTTLPVWCSSRPLDLGYRLTHEWRVALGLEKHATEDLQGEQQ